MTRITLAAALAALTAASAAAADLRICVEGAYPPFSQTSDSGDVVGFDIDIANALCAEMGKTCEMVATEWDAIIPALEEGKCDAIVASMSITEERKQRIDFTAKYYQTPARFAAAEGAGLEDTPSGLAGKRVCVQRGTIHHDYMEGAFPKADLVLYPTQDEVFLDLGSGRCDAILADSMAIQDGFLATSAGAGFAFFGADHTDPKYFGNGAGIGVRKADTELRDALSAAIAAIRANGVYKEINDRYFAFDIYGG
ncbi:MAG: lysine/arginine/ornithine ABC transporter substrate-binding protein [Rubrimonas sp.]|uniref:lysine/arginine/ornithine ABC transporter substrate-binding protein n=1 Tax=Rubrimonas sp. TaxID=2036015 RepID=UPI002FDD7585